MKATTLFNAYIRCVTSRESAIGARGYSFGIKVANDPWALHWQRRDRQARKLQERLLWIMAQVDALNEEQAQ